jgi:hypothetical protein
VWRPRNALCEEATDSNCMIGSYMSIACSKLDAFGKRRGTGKFFVVLSSPTDRRRVATDVTDQGTQLSTGNAWRQAYIIRCRERFQACERACHRESITGTGTRNKLLLLITTIPPQPASSAWQLAELQCQLCVQGCGKEYDRPDYVLGNTSSLATELRNVRK